MEHFYSSLLGVPHLPLHKQLLGRRDNPLWKAHQNEPLVFISILALIWHFCLQPHSSPVGTRKFISRFFVLFVSWCEQIAAVLTFVCFPETFPPSSEGESLACRSFWQLIENIWGSQSLPQSLLTTDIAQHSFLFLHVSPFRCQQWYLAGIPPFLLAVHLSSSLPQDTQHLEKLRAATSDKPDSSSGIPCPSAHTQNLKMGSISKSVQRDLKLNYGKP